MPEPNAASPPTLTGLIGRYRIERPLGKGAMGQVYLAHDTMLERDVALKVMVAQIADDPEAKQRFEREAKAVAKMTHPNVVNVFDIGYHTDGSPYIVMEYLKGQDLQKALRQPPPLPVERKVAVIIQVLAGLNQAHQSGIVHRDIKPANIWIQEDGSAKIMDFGVARDTAGSMTGTGAIMGTPDYMSPEQAQGKKVDGRSDVFAVGAMLYELVTGRRPFHAESLMAIFYKLMHEDPDYSLVPPGESYRALVPILRRALARNVEERYARAYDFAVDLRDWLKAHGGGAGQSAAAGLVDLEAPTHAPLQMTAAPGSTARPGTAATLDAPPAFAPTVVQGGATVDARPGSSGSLRAATTGAQTRAGGRTVVEPGPTVRTGPSARPARPAARVQPAPSASVLPWVAVGLALVAVIVAGGLVWKLQQAPATPPVTQALAPATTLAPPPATLAATPTPPPTPAPPPSFAEAEGKAATAIRAAQAAFRSGSYDRAVASAQQALREDPGNTSAQKVLDNALAGQKAALELKAAEAALAQADFAAADAHVAAARGLAPWDAAVPALAARVADARGRAEREAQSRTQQARASQVNALLNEAAGAMEKRQFEAAVAAYNRVLEVDPGNAVAQTGKSNAITARTVAEASAGAGRPGALARTFVPGKTEAKGGEGAGGLVGFEESAGVVVKKGTQASELPGRVVFEANPASPKAGERYRIVVSLANDGAQPIQLSALTVATTVDGRRQAGALPPSATTVAPGSRAVVWQSPSELVWKDGISSWTMEILLQTTKGESYRNTLTWK
jgi:eukaryotic-like serine/threonine-protein kinase